MKIRIAGVEKESIVDGEGLRYVIFTQGCGARCKGCHNPQTWDLNGGYLVDVETLIEEFTSNPLLKGITLSGGEPFIQARECLALAEAAHRANLDVWCYTGMNYNNLRPIASSYWFDAANLLAEIDVLVDGEFREDLKSLDLRFRGSSNQRIIYFDRFGKIDHIEGGENYENVCR